MSSPERINGDPAPQPEAEADPNQVKRQPEIDNYLNVLLLDEQRALRQRRMGNSAITPKSRPDTTIPADRPTDGPSEDSVRAFLREYDT